MELIPRIIEAYNKAKEHQKELGAIYKPSPMWKTFLLLRKPLTDALSARDEKAVEELLSNLWHNGCSCFIAPQEFAEGIDTKDEEVIQRMYDRILQEVRAWKHYTDGERNLKDLQIPKIGKPYGVIVNNIPIVPGTPRYHYYSRKIKALLDGIENPVVAEIGGGIGLLAYFLTRDSNIQYIEFDLPEVLVVSQYFLMKAFPEKRFLLYGEDRTDEPYDYILMPHFEIRNLVDNSVDVFVNFHSISEMNLDTITEYMGHIARATKEYFYHENSGYGLIVLGSEPDETAGQNFVVPDSKLIRLSMTPAIFGENVYREFLYKRRK